MGPFVDDIPTSIMIRYFEIQHLYQNICDGYREMFSFKEDDRGDMLLTVDFSGFTSSFFQLSEARKSGVDGDKEAARLFLADIASALRTAGIQSVRCFPSDYKLFIMATDDEKTQKQFASAVEAVRKVLARRILEKSFAAASFLAGEMYGDATVIKGIMADMGYRPIPVKKAKSALTQQKD